jgi:hypothetical protein
LRDSATASLSDPNGSRAHRRAGRARWKARRRTHRR